QMVQLGGIQHQQRCPHMQDQGGQKLCQGGRVRHHSEQFKGVAGFIRQGKRQHQRQHIQTDQQQVQQRSYTISPRHIQDVALAALGCRNSGSRLGPPFSSKAVSTRLCSQRGVVVLKCLR